MTVTYRSVAAHAACWAVLALFYGSSPGCGGKAVVDGAQAGTGGSGASGPGSSTGRGPASSTGSSPLCVTPDPIGSLTDCGGTTVGVSTGGFECESCLIDLAGNNWIAHCDQDGACQCNYNGQLKCTCAGGNGCTDSCCPVPFP